jgi:hypothetical protein
MELNQPARDLIGKGAKRHDRDSEPQRYAECQCGVGGLGPDATR